VLGPSPLRAQASGAKRIGLTIVRGSKPSTVGNDLRAAAGNGRRWGGQETADHVGRRSADETGRRGWSSAGAGSRGRLTDASISTRPTGPPLEYALVRVAAGRTVAVGRPRTRRCSPCSTPERGSDGAADGLGQEAPALGVDGLPFVAGRGAVMLIGDQVMAIAATSESTSDGSSVGSTLPPACALPDGADLGLVAPRVRDQVARGHPLQASPARESHELRVLPVRVVQLDGISGMIDLDNDTLAQAPLRRQVAALGVHRAVEPGGPACAERASPG